MTPAQRQQFALAQVAAIITAAAVARSAVTNSVVLELIPMLRSMNPFSNESVNEFSTKAAELVEMGRQEVGRIAWGSISSQVSAYGYQLESGPTAVGPGRATDLQVAYQRVAADYRRRVAAGAESISETIAQAEEQRYQNLGGGEVDAEVQAVQQSQAAAEPAARKAESGAAGGSQSAQPAAQRQPARNTEVNRTADDEEAADIAAERARRDDEERAAEDAVERAAELRRAARLAEEERADLLAQVAQHEMEMRTERMVNDDMGMAGRQAAQDAMSAAPRGVVVGYRRVLHPELSETGTCGLCIAASDRIYKVKELMPIHNLCKCEPTPVYKNADPGSQINDEDLDVLYVEAGSTTHGWELKKQRYEVFDHPELGPVLRNTKHSKKDIEFSPREPSNSHDTGKDNA